MSAQERLAAALQRTWPAKAQGRAAHERNAEAILAADPDLATDLELGAAWRAAEAALPVPESVVEGIAWEKGKSLDNETAEDRWHARAYRWDAGRPWQRLYADGPTPTAALNALTQRFADTSTAAASPGAWGEADESIGTGPV